MAGCQHAVELGDGGVVVLQPLPDRPRHAELGLRLRRSARVPEQVAKIVVAGRQSLRKSLTAGLSIGQPLLNRNRRACTPVRLHGRLPRRRQQIAEPIELSPPGRLRLRSVAPAPASACWSAWARRSFERASAVVAGLVQQPAEPAPACAQALPARRWKRVDPPGRRAAVRPRGTPPPPGRTCRSIPAAARWRPGCGRRRPWTSSPEPGSDASASRAASTLRCAASASSVRPTKRVSAATSKFARASASARPGPTPGPGAPPACRRSRRPTSSSRSRSSLNWSSFSRKSSLTPVWNVSYGLDGKVIAGLDRVLGSLQFRVRRGQGRY